MAAERGYDVAINYRQRLDEADRVAEQCVDLGAQAFVVRADIGHPDQIVSMFDEVAAELGSIDVLVNNAGILYRQDRLQNMSAERISSVIQVNVVGTMICCREAVRHMSTKRSGRGGSIVNVSSAASYLGSPDEYIDYAATKGAVDTLTIGLAKEVADEGIRVNAVRPGLIKTDIHASGGEPGRVDRLSSAIPMKRGGEAAEVAEAIHWLASPAASYVTGALINIAGGR